MENKKKKNVWEKILEILGFSRISNEELQFHRDANIRSTIYMAGVIVILEIWMILRFIKKYVVTGIFATFPLFMEKSQSYWILLSSGVIMMIYSILYTRKKIRRSPVVSNFLIIVFTGICMYFGWKVSASDFSKGRMIICFMTMALYVACLLIWRPYVSMIMISILSISYIWYLDNFAPNTAGELHAVLEADKINYATYFISLITVVVSIYNQRHSEAKKSAKLTRISVTDDLTGLSNMRGFAEKAEKLLAESDREKLVYLFFNIENFKIYNDHMGFVKGNELLVFFSELITREFPGDILSRPADDHFIVLTRSPNYIEIIKKIQNALRNETPDEMYLNLKVGIYRPSKEDTDPRLEIDRARYAANSISNKADKTWCEYDTKMDDQFKLRNYIINNIDKAVREGYIQVYYQPVVWSKDKKLCGCEALARWIDPKMGFMSPGAFIPILEETRQINKLDLCIYETVCKDLRAKLDEGKKIFPVSLNFSRLDFELMDAVAELEKLVKKYSIPKDYLHVEITESALTNDTEGLKKTIKVLHNLGYSVWLDDFGSGYSSLNVLKDFNFDVLKLDMVFLKNFNKEGFEENTENTKKIICTVLDLADNLGMRTLTEGVEDQACVDFLTSVGCDRLQGYFYSKPVPIEDVYKMIDEKKFEIADSFE